MSTDYENRVNRLRMNQNLGNVMKAAQVRDTPTLAFDDLSPADRADLLAWRRERDYWVDDLGEGWDDRDYYAEFGGEG